MSLHAVRGHLPFTGDPVDGYLVVGSLLLALGAQGLLTGTPGLEACGVATVAAIVLLLLSGREDGSASHQDPAAAATDTRSAGTEAPDADAGAAVGDDPLAPHDETGDPARRLACCAAP